MNKIIRWLNWTAGGALIFTGALLSELPFIELAQPTNSDSYLLVQIHFILTGLVSIWASTANQRNGLVDSASLGTGGVNAWLGYLALTSGSDGVYWPLLFTAASALNWAYLVRASVKKEPPETSRETIQTGPSENDDGLVSPSFGATGSTAIFSKAFSQFNIIVLISILTVAIVFVGAIYVGLLTRVIFEDADISFARLAEHLFSGDENGGLFEVGIYIVVIAIVYGGVLVIEAALNILMRNRSLQSSPDLNRNLSLNEQIFIRDAFFELLDYLEHKRFAPKWRTLYITGSVLVIISMFAIPAVVVFVEIAIGDALSRDRLGSEEPLFYSGPYYIGGAVAAFFAGTATIWALFQLLGKRHPDFAEYAFAQAGWNSMNNRPREPGELLWVLVRHVRTRLVNTDQPFNPHRFLAGAFSERESIVYKTAIIASILTVILAVADLARFQLVDQHGVSYSKYFHFQTHVVPYSDIDRIEVRCVLFRPNEDGDVNLGLDYVLVKDGAFRIDLLFDEPSKDRLEGIIALDERLNELGIKVAPAQHAGFLQGDKPVFVSNCSDEIAKRRPPEIAEKLSALIRSDQFSASP